MAHSTNDTKAYRSIVAACGRLRDGATTADMVARTALPLETVKELLPAVADEYDARLRVSESGEILYSFPNGMKSRYRGFGPTLRKALSSFGRTAAKVGTFLFKIWIVVMLVGYFVLFLLLALVAMLASTAARASSNSDDRDDRGDGGLFAMFAISNILDLIVRIWFYSELTKSMDSYYYGDRGYQKPKKRPLHHAVYSFVFGDEDPNQTWAEDKKKEVIAFIQANKGLITLGEFMILTGFAPAQAETEITRYLVEFNGSPEVSDEGTIFYRFEDLMLRSSTTGAETARPEAIKGFGRISRRLKKFSSNKSTMNTWFAVINGVNVLFGSYFLYGGLVLGEYVKGVSQVTGFSYFYFFVQQLFEKMAGIPTAATLAVLGVVPLTFSVLFYLIPFVRSRKLRKENEEIKTENLRKRAVARIWEEPLSVTEKEIAGSGAEDTPENLAQARDRIIKEIGAWASPEVAIASDGATKYAFPDIKREKQGLRKEREKVSLKAYDIGKTVFDSHAN